MNNNFKLNTKPSDIKVSCVKMVEVIEVTSTAGEGTPESPSRLVRQYWDKEGKWLANVDPWEKEKKKLERKQNDKQVQPQ